MSGMTNWGFFNSEFPIPGSGFLSVFFGVFGGEKKYTG
jgi:hypothetical protein